jgi:uncharacterized metal-binding protein
MSESLPILFACAGCSNAGRLSYDIARALDAGGDAEMSCLAGVAARKQHFHNLKKLTGRRVWVIDGCPIECARGVLEQADERVDVHIRLHQLGVRKYDPPDESRFAALVAAARAAVGELTAAAPPTPAHV